MVEEAVNQLDEETLASAYAGHGSLPYAPDLMLKIALMEILEGRPSPAQWYRDAAENDPLKWLGRGIKPGRTTWYDFRDRLDKVIGQLNTQLIQQATSEQLLHPELASQDGSTFRSQASRHQAFNHSRLEKHKAHVQAAVNQDQTGEPAIETVPKWMPATVSGRRKLLVRIEKAEQRLKQRLQENQAKPRNKRQNEKHVVVSLTDPDAVFARDKEKTYCFLYTAQLMVDNDSLMIIGYSLAGENTDVGTIGQMIDQVQANVGGTLMQVSADSSYSSALDLQDCEERNINLLAPVSENSLSHIKAAKKDKPKLFSRDEFQWRPDRQEFECPGGQVLTYRTKERLARHGGREIICRHYQCLPKHCLACALANQCTTSPALGRRIKRLDGQERIDAQREKMKQPEAKKLYARRSQTIERAFGDAKLHRSIGRLRGRGLLRARASIGLLVLGQNILGLNRLRKSKIPAIQKE